MASFLEIILMRPRELDVRLGLSNLAFYICKQSLFLRATGFTTFVMILVIQHIPDPIYFL